MVTLTEALNRIMKWLQQYTPEFANSFLPGLTREEIEEIIKALPGKVPEEIYQLYQFRNGTLKEMKSTVYPLFEFLPLAESVEVCLSIIDNFGKDEPLVYEGKYLLPFLCDNCCYCAVLLNEEQQPESPVIDIAAECDLSMMYRNLTSMMLTLAEYLESEVCYLDTEGFLVTDDDRKMAQIFQKYNPGLQFLR
ncbi:MAG TPA: hypothetical protein V6D28_05075 [Leptolyngbyaceae cyanobacterium]